ncbi:DegT/DnrJ/EryC1/StrS family aminotransferase [Marinimicrobium sp. ARAG 43.8]|uniref:DegT/DnrJ/EryC1/StrS family aminotransferase n=1 Tax=Marinimicrobium sp. ARAG 43.8 TaxID=3418719 RepID=UPI003CF9AA34
MDSFSSLIKGVLPPAGDRIVLRQDDDQGPDEAIDRLFPGKQRYWLDSGTSALALALTLIRRQHPGTPAPEVIIPAYCCPDLVAAAVYAGITPVLADLADGSCHYDQPRLRTLISSRTIAIIAINFLGLSEPIHALRSIANQHSIALIEDNAQWFPSSSAPYRTPADFQVFSFARGKPVNLMGGGLLVSAVKHDHEVCIDAEKAASTWQYYGKCVAYNRLRQPVFYQMVSKNPLLKLGETRYQPHTAMLSMSRGPRSLLSSNVRAYWTRTRAVEHFYRKHLARKNQLGSQIDSTPARLLRYPLLTPCREQRDELLYQLNKKGLGASQLYGASLTSVANINVDQLKQPLATPSADAFAERLLTLPLHESVKPEHTEETLRTIRKVLG